MLIPLFTAAISALSFLEQTVSLAHIIPPLGNSWGAVLSFGTPLPACVTPGCEVVPDWPKALSEFEGRPMVTVQATATASLNTITALYSIAAGSGSHLLTLTLTPPLHDTTKTTPFTYG
ncbi:hypothetical protein AAFF_G00432950 [Aldrovandia affinis]|uniref:Uncharacterized protein n=1 Tax=Aldrovandia affinis TaxID=143900 RepID=A0AAD7WIE0_9TELE|nr:hypothetical protein AAFF_G00432950 [Aldrovandia affinis]